ncbi:MAG: hypothetical protein K8T91_17260, partial [Planctomycetes bacterium]|nr:hypothetical protein [Planctomycetota bacterium]
GDDSGERIRRHMREVRAQMVEDADHMADATRTMTDWRAYVRRYPWLFVGGAALVGYALIPRKSGTVSLDAETLRQLSRCSGQAQTSERQRPRPTMLSSLLSTIVSIGAQHAMRGVSQYMDQRRTRNDNHRQTAPSGVHDAAH